MSIFALKLLKMLLVYVLFCLSLYSVLLLAFTIGWFRIKAIPASDIEQVKISVVVCARNEETTIGILLTQLVIQSFQPVEIIVVDDGSIDNTASIVKQFSQVKLLFTSGIGKKMALKIGGESSTGELIVCTDADCRVGADWLRTMAQCFESLKPSMIIAPVRLLYNHSFWQRIQALEFMSLTASTAGAAGFSHPVMCNGANLAFTKQAWFKCSNDLVFEQPSGDDMFLMMSLKRRKESIIYLKSKEAIVTTTPCLSVSDFVNQRSRWVSKSSSYKDIEVTTTAIIVFVMGIMPIALSIFALFVPSVWLYVLLFWSVKTFADALFLNISSSFFSTKMLLWLVIPLSLIYPFYLLTVTFLGLIGDIEWKGINHH